MIDKLWEREVAAWRDKERGGKGRDRLGSMIKETGGRGGIRAYGIA
jgi:hypothetical protein